MNGQDLFLPPGNTQDAGEKDKTRQGRVLRTRYTSPPIVGNSFSDNSHAVKFTHLKYQVSAF